MANLLLLQQYCNVRTENSEGEEKMLFLFSFKACELFLYLFRLRVTGGQKWRAWGQDTTGRLMFGKVIHTREIYNVYYTFNWKGGR